MSDATKAVFLSYASQDAAAAKRIADALRAAGVEVWFDQSELVGGDAWDAKIRKQIAECALFVPLISANTQARREGYFRLEWRIAAQRTHMMSESVAFLLPLVIDATRDPEADVPGEFKGVQWTRLPDGETPAAFTTRVASLLAGEAGRVRLVPPAASKAGSGPVRQPQRVRYRRWLAPALVGGVVFLGALFWSQSRNLLGPASAQPSGAMSQTSGARRFVAQAWVQLNKPQLARAELEVAEGFAKQATEADSADAEAWAVSSQVDSWFVLHGLDATAERREAARSKAAKALQLAPTNYEARLAQACYLVRGGGDLVAASDMPAADEVLQSLLKERPDEPRALLALATLQGNAGRMAEALSTYERLAANPDFAVVAWNEIGWADYVAGHYADAEVAAGRSVALQSYWGNLTLQALLAVWWRGDLGLAKSIYDRIPAAVRQEDHGVANDCQLLFLRREPDALLRLLDGVPRDWLHSNAYDGPKALWAALANEQLGRTERARLQWQTVLTQVERPLADHPDADALLRLKALALAALGQGAEADRVLQLARESTSAGSIQAFLRDVATQLRLGHPDAALDSLEHEPRLTAAACRIAPQFDVLRSQPRFQALQARLDSDPQASPNAAKAMVTPVVDQKSVAVLAFANLSDDKANEYFSDGISEELLNVLAKVPGLKVTARTSSFHFKGTTTAIPEIASQLGVAYVVEGSVRKAGDKVRITAQLIKAADGFHVWSDTFTRDLKDIFAVQDEIAGLIAQNLQAKMALGRERPAVTPEAYALSLQARHAASQLTIEGGRQAVKLYREMLALAPADADAWAELAYAYQYLARFGGMDISEGMREARLAARKALELDPEQPVGLAAFGWVQRTDEHDWRGAVQSFRHALAAAPENVALMSDAAICFLNVGLMDEAIALASRAVERDPLNPKAHWSLGIVLTNAGKPAQAEAPFRRAVELAPAAVEYHSHLARTLTALNRLDEAKAVALAETSEGYRIATLIGIYYHAGDKITADRLMAELIAKYGGSMAGYIAVIYAQAGNPDEAFKWLERAYAARDAAVAWSKTSAFLRSLHGDPRWPIFLRKMGLADDQLK